MSLDAESCKLPTAAAALPVITTLALLGELSVAPPLGLDNVNVKDLLPIKATALLIATLNVLGVASPLAH